MNRTVLIALIMLFQSMTVWAWWWSSDPSPSPSPSPSPTVDQIAKWCSDVRDSIAAMKWKVDPCNGIQWRIGGSSVNGRPLIYTEFGDPNGPNTTLVFTMVHGDEVTPLYVGLQLVQWLKAREGDFSKTRVVVAPLVNPDSFFKRPRTRVNANGVDVNRNFATSDWDEKALKAWKVRFRSNPRRFPGNRPRSEPETIFQEELIRLIRPQKILSIHAPLNFMDYDGPTPLSLAQFPRDYIRECVKLRKQLKAVSGGFFPGSLGNFAGRELGIPTLTLELPSANPAKADQYWKRFSVGIRTMIDFVVPSVSISQTQGAGG